MRKANHALTAAVMRCSGSPLLQLMRRGFLAARGRAAATAVLGRAGARAGRRAGAAAGAVLEARTGAAGTHEPGGRWAPRFG